MRDMMASISSMMFSGLRFLQRPAAAARDAQLKKVLM